MNRFLSIAISILFLVGVAGLVIFFKPNAPVPPEQVAAEASAKTYANAEHGYALSYPERLNIQEYTPEIATIGTPIEGGIEGVADVRVEVVEGEPGASFAESAARQLANLCAADGPDASFSCTGLKSVVPFATDTGTAGFEIFLTGERTDRAAGTVTETDKGPYIAFVLATSASATKVLIVHAPLNVDAAGADRALIETIAKSVRIE